MSETNDQDLTGLLVAWSRGDDGAMSRLMPRVYDELRRLAGRYLNRERADHTLQATALVNEAWMRLIDQQRVQWRDSLHFVALAATMMRRILVDHARARGSEKRGADARRIPLDDAPPLGTERAPDLVALDDALEALAAREPGLARIVELRFFGGLRSEEIAELLGISVPTVTRRWRMAKAWLYRYLSGEDPRER